MNAIGWIVLVVIIAAGIAAVAAVMEGSRAEKSLGISRQPNP